MAVKPILFNTEMVRAILDGRKTVTRRIVKQAEHLLNSPYCKEHPETPESQVIRKLAVPPYQVGDVLYIRETYMDAIVDGHYIYRADDRADAMAKTWLNWTPSIHMPKKAARIWLRVTDVSVEKLRDITIEECKREGIYDDYKTLTDEYHNLLMEKAYPETFTKLWDSTIKKSDLDKYGWDASPYVWRIEFERTEKPEEI